MALPIKFDPSTALILTVNPAALTPVLVSYAVNAVVRVAAHRAIQSVSGESESESLALIAERLNRHDPENSELEHGVADVIYEKECGIRDAHLEVNIIPPEEHEQYASSWTAYT